MEIDADVGGRTTLAGLTAPDPIVVLLELVDISVARIFNLGFRLSLGKAIPTCNGLIGVVLIRAVDSLVIRARLGWGF